MFYLWVCFFFATFTSLLYFLDSTCKWCHRIFVFLRLTYFTKYPRSPSMLLQMANFILSYGWIVFYYIYTFVLCCAQSCLTLCDPLDYSPPGSSVHGILQARILGWVAMPFSRGSFQPRDRTGVSCAGEFFTSWATREAPIYTYICILYVLYIICMYKHIHILYVLYI